MFTFIAVFLVLVVILPAVYALMVHFRDQREKKEERIRNGGGNQ